MTYFELLAKKKLNLKSGLNHLLANKPTCKEFTFLLANKHDLKALWKLAKTHYVPPPSSVKRDSGREVVK